MNPQEQIRELQEQLAFMEEDQIELKKQLSDHQKLIYKLECRLSKLELAQAENSKAKPKENSNPWESSGLL